MDLKSKFLSTQQKYYMSPIHPINMKSIGLKLTKIEQIKIARFFFSLTVLGGSTVVGGGTVVAARAVVNLCAHHRNFSGVTNNIFLTNFIVHFRSIKHVEM